MWYQPYIYNTAPRRIDIILVRFILSILSVHYRVLVMLRTKAYEKNIFKSFRLLARVISIGNITVGGTGKTPLVLYLAGLLKKDGRRVVIISRGYKGKHKGNLLVSDQTRVLSTPERAGDEPYLLAVNAPGVPVIVNKDRKAAGLFAAERFKPEFILLDDGFQHLKVFRDLDILAVDASCPRGTGKLLPRGTLREPVSACSRADMIILTKTNQVGTAEEAQQALAPYTAGKKVIDASYHIDTIESINRDTAYELEELAGRKVFIFSGIANPGSFRRSVEELTSLPVGEAVFPDHHPYTPADLAKIDQQARREQARLILTTEKDAVRLPKNGPFSLPVCKAVLRLECSWAEPDLLAALTEGV